MRCLIARNSTERLGGEYDLESKGSVFSCTRSKNTALPSIYECGIMLILKGAVFLLDPLYCCTLPDCLFSRELYFCYTDKSSGGIQKKSASLNLAKSSVIRSECSFRKSCPRELAHSPSYSQRALDLGRILSYRTPA